MTIITGRRRGAALLATSALVVATASGCGFIGGVDTKATCAKVLNELNSIASQAASSAGSAQSIKTVYDNGAAKLREIGKGTDLQNETEQTAAAMEKLGKQLVDLEANPGSARPQIDSKAVLDAGVALRTACSA